MSDGLAVVVMGYRNAATVERALASVVRQAGPDVEVVVVTSGGDATADLVRRTHPAVPVVAHPGRWMPGAARNAGIEATSARWVAFLAADNVAGDGWVAGRLAAHRCGHAVVASAMGLWGRRTPSALAVHLAMYGGRLPGGGSRTVVPPAGAAHGCSYDRALFERFGGFDPALRVGEDTELALRLAAGGVVFWFDERVITEHEPPARLVAAVRDQYARGGRGAPAGGRGAVDLWIARTRSSWRLAVGNGAARADLVRCAPAFPVVTAAWALGRASARRRAPAAARTAQ